jgi:surface polysaccharide O-acyltransferase-like enzyme
MFKHAKITHRCPQIIQETPSHIGKISHIDVDLIRTVAIIGVILLHAANDLTIQQPNTLEIFRWTTVDVYQSLGRIGVPLFILLSGALLLVPTKADESMRNFFRKRFLRVGLPFVFWVIIYFLWDFTVKQQAVTTNFIVQGLLSGPYYHFWYIYMLFGLYLLTPVLRVVVAYAKRSVIKFFLAVWFIGSALLPILDLLTPYRVDSNLLTVPLYVGIYMLGVFLVDVHLKRSQLALYITAGVALTAVFTYALAATIGGATMYYFQDYSSATMILASASVFLLLLSYAPPTLQQDGGHPSAGRRLLHVISESTLAIYFLHLIVIETLQNGYLGFAINGNTINSIVGVPLMTALTLFLCLAIVVPLKKVPYLKKLIG